MSEDLAHANRTMGKNVVVLTVACLMLCMSFNYTFPLHKDTANFHLDNYSLFHKPSEHNAGIVDRNKKKAVALKNGLKKIFETTTNLVREKCSHDKHAVVDNDLSNYEQLVIMKKYPFLDLQEVDINVAQLAFKNAGQQNLNSAQALTAQDPSFHESLDEGPNVEITNRGLSGFALPMKLVKPEARKNSEDKEAEQSIPQIFEKESSDVSVPTKQLPDDLRLIQNLGEAIKMFEQLHMG